MAEYPRRTTHPPADVRFEAEEMRDSGVSGPRDPRTPLSVRDSPESLSRKVTTRVGNLWIPEVEV